MIKSFEDYNNGSNELSREEKIQFIIDNNENLEDDKADIDDIRELPDDLLDKFYNNVLKETSGLNESDGSTSAVVGSGTAVSGGATGSFVSAMGTSVSGGDSGSSFATNSTISGMGPIISAQPSSIPGDVAGSTKGSGDIGQVLGVYSKTPAVKKRKKNNRRKNAINKIDNLYTTKYVQSGSGGRIIQNWKTFNESMFGNNERLKPNVK